MQLEVGALLLAAIMDLFLDQIQFLIFHLIKRSQPPYSLFSNKTNTAIDANTGQEGLCVLTLLCSSLWKLEEV